MLELQFPLPVKLVFAFIYSSEDSYQRSKRYLTKKYGKIDFESEAIDFEYTHYYQKEMGGDLKRRFISFEKLQKADRFVDIKLLAVKLEKKLAVDKKRIVNIDPGYISEAKMVLTTTKDFAHRIYLKKGVFAEVTLSYSNGQFNDLPTTFPDYRTLKYKDILIKMRNTYRQQIKANNFK